MNDLRERVIKAQCVLSNFANITEDDNERINLSNFIRITRKVINLALSILRLNKDFLKDPFFQNVEENDIVLEVLYNYRNI